MVRENTDSGRTDVLGTAPVGKLFRRMSLPIVVSMLVNGAYNLVDAAFVTRGVGPLAMGGVALAFPLHMLMYSAGAMIGNGAASIISRTLGARQVRMANSTALRAIVLGLVLSLVFVAVGLWLLEPILGAFGATDALRPYARDYMTPLLLGAPIVLYSTIFAELLRAEGKMGAMSGILMLSTFSNIILAALFVFVLKAGVTGVACGTLIAQALGLGVAVSLYLRGRTAVTLFPPQPGPTDTPNLARSLLALGLPAFLGNGGIALTVGLANRALSSYAPMNADLLIGAYGVVGRIAAFVQLPLIGMMIAYQTLAGYNYGARRFTRVREVVRVGIATATVYTVSCCAILVLFPATLLALFTSDPRLIEQGASIARIVFLGLGCAGVSIMGAALFQALGKARPALFLSTVKVFLVLTPLLFILPLRYGVPGIWAAFPIADLTVFAVVSVFLVRQYRLLRQGTDGASSPSLAVKAEVG